MQSENDEFSSPILFLELYVEKDARHFIENLVLFYKPDQIKPQLILN